MTPHGDPRVIRMCFEITSVERRTSVLAVTSDAMTACSVTQVSTCVSVKRGLCWSCHSLPGSQHTSIVRYTQPGRGRGSGWSASVKLSRRSELLHVGFPMVVSRRDGEAVRTHRTPQASRAPAGGSSRTHDTGCACRRGARAPPDTVMPRLRTASRGVTRRHRRSASALGPQRARCTTGSSSSRLRLS